MSVVVSEKRFSMKKRGTWGMSLCHSDKAESGHLASRGHTFSFLPPTWQSQHARATPADASHPACDAFGK